MYGWRGRIGLIVASTNRVAEMEAFRMLPSGVSVHFSRIPYAGTGTEEAQAKMLEALDSSARVLAGSDETVAVDVIGLAHGSGTLSTTSGFDSMINERMAKLTGVPCITMSSAILKALKALSVKKIGTATPLRTSSMLERMKAFMEANGFQVVPTKKLDLETHYDVSGQPPESAYRLMKSLNNKEVEAVVINNANLRTLEIIEPLEQDIGKPVVTGNTALMWACLRAIGIRDRVTGGGRLFLQN